MCNQTAERSNTAFLACDKSLELQDHCCRCSTNIMLVPETRYVSLTKANPSKEIFCFEINIEIVIPCPLGLRNLMMMEQIRAQREGPSLLPYPLPAIGTSLLP